MRLQSGFTGARDSEWQWHQLGDMQICTLTMEPCIMAIIQGSMTWPRHITTPASHQSVFYRLDGLPAAQPTASKHWKQVILLAASMPHTCWYDHPQTRNSRTDPNPRAVLHIGQRSPKGGGESLEQFCRSMFKCAVFGIKPTHNHQIFTPRV